MPKRKTTKNEMKIIYIEWADAISNSKWFTSSEALAWGEKTYWIIKEAGWLVKETPKYILIASGWSPENEQADEQFVGLHKIPKTWIIKRTVLLDTKKVKGR